MRSMDLVNTIILHIRPERINPDKMGVAASFIRQGKLVAFPTETVYGLGANAFNSLAVSHIFEVKGRPADNPLIVHVSNESMIDDLIRYKPEFTDELMKAFWPGPMTLVLPKTDTVPDNVTCGLDTVAVRMPSHPIARTLISRARLPIAAPSANLSGRPSPTTGKHVIEELRGKISCIIDGGACSVGVESTVIDLTGSTPKILRPGGVTYEMLKEVVPDIIIATELKGKPASPGMKYKHYAPRAPLILASREKIQSIADEYQKQGKKVGVMITSETRVNADTVMIMGSLDDLKEVARNMFRMIRDLDKVADVIIVQIVPERDEGLAVMNRLKKAASKIIP